MSAYTRKDAGYRAAREAGWRSRAAPKLIELDDRFRILATGRTVVDLGCWPGGWLQVAAERVGGSGKVVGVDLQEVEDLALDNVFTLTGDLGRPEVRAELRAAAGENVDVVLSDMAPKITGVKVADRERHLELAELGLELAGELLAGGGKRACFVIKLFSGVEGEVTAALKGRFAEVAKYRPAATRKGSSELYAVCKKLRADR